jgi:hypothetical protein
MASVRRVADHGRGRARGALSAAGSFDVILSEAKDLIQQSVAPIGDADDFSSQWSGRGSGVEILRRHAPQDDGS